MRQRNAWVFPRVFLVVALFLSGCASHKYPVPVLKKATYAPNLNALVLVRTYSIKENKAFFVKTVWGKFDPQYQTTSKSSFSFEPEAKSGFAKYIPGFKEIGQRLSFGQNASYELYQIPPGRYVLDWFSATLAGRRFETPADDGWELKKSDAKWASFEVDPGDLVYLGDIRFFFSDSEAGIDIVNNRDEAEEFVKKYYPWVRSGIEFRPAVITWDKQYQPALGKVEPKTKTRQLSIYDR